MKEGGYQEFHSFHSLFLCVSLSEMKLRKGLLHSIFELEFKEEGGAEFMIKGNGRLTCDLR
jgi:hypothetical protein